MEDAIGFLNAAAHAWLPHSAAMLWQVSLVVAVVLAVDLMLARKLRAVVRHALWILVLVKLLLPPGLAFPTAPAYWWPTGAKPEALPTPVPTPSLSGERSQEVAGVSMATVLLEPATVFEEERSEVRSRSVSAAAWLFLSWLAGCTVLVALVLRRAWQVRRMLRDAPPAPEDIQRLFCEVAAGIGLKRVPRLAMASGVAGPSVCGLVRPVVVLPLRLLERLGGSPLKAVFLHELAHVKRGDLWLNHLQAALQIAYWWHPLVWVANARMRRVREEAVDETVVVALGGEVEGYAATLVDVTGKDQFIWVTARFTDLAGIPFSESDGPRVAPRIQWQRIAQPSARIQAPAPMIR